MKKYYFVTKLWTFMNKLLTFLFFFICYNAQKQNKKMVVFCAFWRTGHLRPKPSNMNGIWTDYDGTGWLLRKCSYFIHKLAAPGKKSSQSPFLNPEKNFHEVHFQLTKFDFLPKFVYNRFRRKWKKPHDRLEPTGAHYIPLLPPYLPSRRIRIQCQAIDYTWTSPSSTKTIEPSSSTTT